MNKPNQFCKAYVARSVRQFAACERHWQELGRNVGDEDILYIHDDFVARSGIYPEDEVVFDQVTDEWKHFCMEELKFEIPLV